MMTIKEITLKIEQLNEWLDQCPIGYAKVDYEDDDIINIVVPQIKEAN